MSTATAEIVGPALGMVGAFLAIVGSLPLIGRALDARQHIEPVSSPAAAPVSPIRGWHVPTARVTRSAYRPTRRARRRHTGAHRLSGLAIGQRRVDELLTIHLVRSHAA